jgi:dihydropyrimidinase
MLAMVHCENDAMITEATRRLVDAGNTGWQFHGQSRPWQAEFEAVTRVIHLAGLAQAAVYIVHCTHAQTVRHLLQMRQHFPEWRFLFETCVQYFTLNDELYQGEYPERFILQPPLRSPESTEDMRRLQTLVDVVSTDHCDYTLAHKQAKNDFTVTPGGLPGLETVLSLVYTHTPLPEEAKLRHIAARMAAKPARIFGLYPRKGIIQPGSDADLVIYDPAPSVTIRAEDLHTIGGYSPYDGMQVQGKVRTTISRGEIIVHEGEFRGTEGRGQFLKGEPFSMPTR